MTQEFCDQLLQGKDLAWKLQSTPCNGFYINLLSYQKSCHPSQTNREMGKILTKIDPCLAATINATRPENVFRKVHRICLRKRNKDALVAYSPKQVPSKNSCKKYMYTKALIIQLSISPHFYLNYYRGPWLNFDVDTWV